MIENLKCNQLEYPLSVNDRARFTWGIAGGMQTAFRLNLFSGNKLVCSSGKVHSDRTVYTEVREFEPETAYRAELTLWTDKGVFRRTCGFRTALTRGFSANAVWIGAPVKQEGSPAGYFRKEFTVTKLKKTYVYLCGLGLYELKINGEKVGGSVLSCPFTDYRKTVLYEAFDITAYLHRGINAAEVTLGDGWYRQNTEDEWGFWRAPWRDEQKLLFEMKGAADVFSDESWLCSSGEIVRSDLRLGETVDLRCKTDWNRAVHAVRAKAPDGALKCLDFEPIRVCGEIPFVKAVPYDGGVLLDFGVNLSGVIRFSGHLNRRQKITFRYGDRLDERGRIDNASNAQYIYRSPYGYQTDTLTADEEGPVVFQPKFVYHGFQYVEIEGLDRIPEKGEITALFYRSGFERTASFCCGDEIIDRLFQLGTASVLANYVGFPSDCPHREKNGWTGDAQLSSDWFFQGFSADLNLLQWLDDLRDSQAENGMIPCIVPTGGWGYEWGNGPAWDYAFFALPACFLRYRGDDFAARRSFPCLKRYFSYLESRAAGDLPEVGLGDWNYPQEIAMEICPTRLTDSCYYMKMAELLAQFSSDPTECAEYEEKARAIRERIARQYIRSDGNVANGSMTALAAVLYFNVVEGDLARRIFQKLESLVEQSMHYRAGILGVKFINRVLCENGRIDLFLKLLQQEDYPSFGNWIRRGATSLWEDFEGTNSRNHHMYSDFCAVLLTYVTGIRQRGANEFEICPYCGAFDYIYGERATPGGVLSVKREKDKVIVTVPPNTKAVLVWKERKIFLKEGKNEWKF